MTIILQVHLVIEQEMGRKEFHNGCDYGTNREKWELYAVEQGEVKLVSKSTIAGNIIEIFYPRLNLTTRFIHCDKIISKKGDKVDNNTKVAIVGMTGTGVTGIHLHLGLKNKGGKFIDPEKYDYQEKLMKSIDELAKEVINGKWGNGQERKQRLSDAGYDYKVIQDKVNEILKQDKPVKPEQKQKTYLVKRGDTLTGIAKNNINMMDLYIKNKKVNR